jgi:hypothetical protein
MMYAIVRVVLLNEMTALTDEGNRRTRLLPCRSCWVTNW